MAQTDADELSARSRNRAIGDVDAPTLDRLVTSCRLQPDPAGEVVLRVTGMPMDLVADLAQEGAACSRGSTSPGPRIRANVPRVAACSSGRSGPFVAEIL